jgi:hypothetical protein
MSGSRIYQELAPSAEPIIAFGRWGYNWRMEVLFAAITTTLFFLTVMNFVGIVRDVLPFLNSEDQASLRGYWSDGGGFSTWRKRDRAIKHAWTEHTRSFPRSRKRVLFACLLIATSLSVIVYPLWLAFGAR